MKPSGGAISRFGRDIVVIILGVLIALGFDSWNSGRADRRLETQYLARLDRDLRADSAMLAEYRRVAMTGEAAGRALMRVLERAPTAAPDSLIGRWFSDATRGAYVTPNRPTIDELETTGNLRVLRDARLRDALHQYYAKVTRFQFSFETVMRRGKDPLGDLGWDLQAYDASVAYAANLGVAGDDARIADAPAPERDGELRERFRAHPEALRLTRRAVTYNAMLQPILTDWERALAEVRPLLLQD